MKKYLIAIGVVALIGAGALAYNAYVHNTGAQPRTIAEVSGYAIRYSWPEQPKVGNYTLKVNVSGKTDAATDGIKVVATYDMPSMRGHHAASEEMKQNAKGDFLLPIHFAMRGDWEIILSAQKDGAEVAREIILLDI